MKEYIKFLMEKYFAAGCERNFVMTKYHLDIFLFDNQIMVESIWRDDNNDYYLHVTDESFEGDIEVMSLSDQNLSLIAQCLLINSLDADIIERPQNEVNNLFNQTLTFAFVAQGKSYLKTIEKSEIDTEHYDTLWDWWGGDTITFTTGCWTLN